MKARGSDTQQRDRCSEDTAPAHGTAALPTEPNSIPTVTDLEGIVISFFLHYPSMDFFFYFYLLVGCIRQV